MQQAAIRQVPKALAELQVRLDRALAESVPKEAHTVTSGVKAEKPVLVKPEPQRVRDVPGRKMPADRPSAEAKATPKPKPKPVVAPNPAVTDAATATKADAAKVKAGDAAAAHRTGADGDPPPLKDTPDRPAKATDKPNDKAQSTVDAVAIADRERVTQLAKEAKAAQESGDAALAASKKEVHQTFEWVHL